MRLENDEDNIREIRLFISSTFRDMAQEREIIVANVFPLIRDFCNRRGVSFTEIDLRWGITDEEARSYQVLKICLDEVDRCTNFPPFFIGILGLVLNRKNIIITLMALELMLLAVNLNFIVFSVYLDDIVGQVFVLFILTIVPRYDIIK